MANCKMVNLGIGAWLPRSFHLCALLLLLCTHESCCVAVRRETYEVLPHISPNVPLLPSPLGSPSPSVPFMNNTFPLLSGRCVLNFTALSSMMTVTSIDCMSPFAPFFANTVCCPQVEAILVILIGQSSKHTNTLSLNTSVAAHCLSDFQQVLVVQGANQEIPKICSLSSSNLTAGSCPISDVAEFENTVDTSTLLAACGMIDSVNECCEQVCQNAILDASRKLAQSDYSTRIHDCKSIVLRWLGSKLDPSTAKVVLRGLSNCRINKVCPLSFASLGSVIKGCGAGQNNQTACCSLVNSYISHLQKQSFVTDLQALNCAASLGIRLRKAKITENLYSKCHVSLKDFSVQVGTPESGCLLPSSASDVVFDKTIGVSFNCNLNDDIPAPWPVSSQFPVSLCNKAFKLPAVPAAASRQSSSFQITDVLCLMLFSGIWIRFRF